MRNEKTRKRETEKWRNGGHCDARDIEGRTQMEKRDEHEKKRRSERNENLEN